MKNKGFVVPALAVIAGTLATLASSVSFSQTYPTRPVRLVVPYVAGGSTDIIGRTMAHQLSELWGHSVLVDNRGGGATIIGTDIVAKGTPDGHVLSVTTAAFGINPALFAGNLPYD
jgi:tripartite-type tricarboxylate transporter receptor subunit TctC